MGFLDLLGEAANIGAQGRTGYLQGKAAKQQQDFMEQLRQAAEIRQQAKDADEARLRQAQIGNLNSETAARSAPKPPKPATPHLVQQADGSYVYVAEPDAAGHVAPPIKTGVKGYHAPPAPRVTPEDKQSTAREDRIRRRAIDLTKPTSDPTNPFLKKPGLSYQDALKQAQDEEHQLDAAMGHAPATPHLTRGNEGPAPATDADRAKEAIRRIKAGGATLEQAMASPALSPAVKALIRQQLGH